MCCSKSSMLLLMCKMSNLTGLAGWSSFPIMLQSSTHAHSYGWVYFRIDGWSMIIESAAFTRMDDTQLIVGCVAIILLSFTVHGQAGKFIPLAIQYLSASINNLY